MRRTLNIGLGGTGIKSILNLRKTLYASGKVLKNIDEQIRYFVIDSHESDISNIADTLKTLDTTAVSNLKFHKNEYSVYSEYLDPNDVKMIVDDIKNGQHEQLKDWLVKESLIGIAPGGATGASQIRNVGRYGFFRIYNDVFNKINAHLEHLNQGRQNGDPIDVNIICSIAGGTGSGALLDVILLLNAMKNLFPGLMITPIIVLPDVFDGVVSQAAQNSMRKYQAKATAYAVLSELDTLCTSKKPFIVELISDNVKLPDSEKFKVRWIPEQHSNPDLITNFTVNTPNLWNMCYLLSSANLPTGTVVDVTKAIGHLNSDFKRGKELALSMYQAIADFVFIKADNDLANGQPRAFPDLFNQEINNFTGNASTQNEYKIGQKSYKLNNLYGSFGISKIYSDIDNLNKVSAFVLLERYIQFKIGDIQTGQRPGGVDDIVRNSEPLKDWKISDIVKKIEKSVDNKKPVTIYENIDNICNDFKKQLDNLIKGFTEPDKIFDAGKPLDINSESPKNVNIPDIMLRSFSKLKEKLLTELDVKTKYIYKNAREVSVDKRSDNDIVNGKSFYECLNEFCLIALKKYNWIEVQSCFQLINERYFVSHQKEARLWLSINKPLRAVFVDFYPYMQDLNSVPKSQQEVTCKTISEHLVNSFSKNCKTELKYHVYDAIEKEFLFQIKPYLDENETSSFLSIINKASKFLKIVLEDVSNKVKDGAASVKNINETAFSTPIINNNLDKIFIDKRMNSAIDVKLGQTGKTSADMFAIEEGILNQLFELKKIDIIDWIHSSLPERSLGAIMLNHVGLNSVNQNQFNPPEKTSFTNFFIQSCYLYLRNDCDLGKNTVVSNEFDTFFSNNLDTVRNQVTKKATILLKKNAQYVSLAPAGTFSIKKYFLSSLRDPFFVDSTRTYSYFSSDTNYLFDAEVVFPLASLDCIRNLEDSYDFVFKGTGNTNSDDIKAEYLHSDFGYFKCFSNPFTEEAIVKRKKSLKELTCILVNAILIGVINKNGNTFSFSVLAGKTQTKIYFDPSVNTFGKLLVEVAKRRYEKELIEAIKTKYDAIKIVPITDGHIFADIKIEIALKLLITNIQDKFSNFLLSPETTIKQEAKDLFEFWMECCSFLQLKFNQETINDNNSSEAKSKFDLLLGAIHDAATRNLDQQ